MNSIAIYLAVCVLAAIAQAVGTVLLFGSDWMAQLLPFLLAAVIISIAAYAFLRVSPTPGKARVAALVGFAVPFVVQIVVTLLIWRAFGHG